MRRGLFVGPLFALVLFACGDNKVDNTVAADTTAGAADTTGGTGSDTIVPDASETNGAPARNGAATFSIVSAVSGAWPNPVTATTGISDIDTEALCKTLLAGGAFGDRTGEYYGGSLSRVDETLEFQCRLRLPGEAPVPLDGFADAFLAGISAPGESPKGEENDSVGLVEITLDGDPLGSTEAGDQFIAANMGCLAAAKAVGLTGSWTTETLGSVDDNRIVTCRGPIVNADVRSADPALVSKVVGSAAPPLD